MRRRLSESLLPEHSSDGTAEIAISPEVDDPPHVAALLLHELVHLTTRRPSHDQVFQRVARSLGFVAPFPDAVAGPELAGVLNTHCVKLGPYPHGKMECPPPARTYAPRVCKLVCEQCPYFTWTTTCCFRSAPPPEHCGRLMHLAPPRRKEHGRESCN